MNANEVINSKWIIPRILNITSSTESCKKRSTSLWIQLKEKWINLKKWLKMFCVVLQLEATNHEWTITQSLRNGCFMQPISLVCPFTGNDPWQGHGHQPSSSYQSFPDRVKDIIANRWLSSLDTASFYYNLWQRRNRYCFNGIHWILDVWLTVRLH